MIITIIAGPEEGKSGTAYWLSEQLKKLGAERVILHDSDTTNEAMELIRENYDKIVNFVAKTQDIHVVTKLREHTETDVDIVSNLKKSGVLKA